MMARENQRDVTISKCLSYILRHGAEKEGIHIMSNGFVSVKELLSHHSFTNRKCTLEDVKRVVANNDKQRFTLHPSLSSEDNNPSNWLIRANQGHTLSQLGAEAIGLKPILQLSDFPSDTIVHGTTFVNWQRIQSSGYLSRMSRNHIHFAVGLPQTNDVISGMRQSSEIVIYLDTEKAMVKELKFFLSENRVVLSPGDSNGRIGKECFKRVVDRRRGGNRELAI